MDCLGQLVKRCKKCQKQAYKPTFDTITCNMDNHNNSYPYSICNYIKKVNQFEILRRNEVEVSSIVNAIFMTGIFQ